MAIEYSEVNIVPYDYYLPKTVTPFHYDLTLQPNLDECTFLGSVTIHYKSTRLAKNIILHANSLKITSGHIKNTEDITFAHLSKVISNSVTEAVVLIFDDMIPLEGTLFLEFSGELNNKLKGFYISSFNYGSTELKMASTHFEATEARRCFPCQDEPAARATFSCKLIVPKKIKVDDQTDLECIALSNTPEKSRESLGDNLVQVSFETTPSMSTYLLAFVVGPLEMIEDMDLQKPIRVYTTPGKRTQGQFALDVACKALPFYEEYFATKYPLAKLDLVAIPDFPIGAMENWGLITFRETVLLVSPESTSTVVKQYVALVVCHEIAHQWFGNLVTIAWWRYLWLKEGFATYMEYVCVDYLFPHWNIWTQFVCDVHGTALWLDGYRHSHCVEMVTNDPSATIENFDAICYKKGASILRLLSDWLGKDTFRLGLRIYLKKHSYGAAKTEDFWGALKEASGKNILKMMESWTLVKGFPFLSMNKSEFCDNKWFKLHVRQRKFALDGDNVPDLIWEIPLNAIAGRLIVNTPDNRVIEKHYMEKDQMEYYLPRMKAESWYKFNPGTIGFYRVLYPLENLERLGQAVAANEIPSASDRISIQDDAVAMCIANFQSLAVVLRLLIYYRTETSYPVWASIDANIGRLSALLSTTNKRSKFARYVKQLYATVYAYVGWDPFTGSEDKDPEDEDTAMLRALIINRLVLVDDDEVTSEAIRRFKAREERPIVADLRSACYRAFARRAGFKGIRLLIKMHNACVDEPEERNRLAIAMAYSCGEDPDRLDKVEKFIMSDKVRIQDKVAALAPIGEVAPQWAWPLFKRNRRTFHEWYATNAMAKLLVKSLTENLSTLEAYENVGIHFGCDGEALPSKEKRFPGAERTILRSMEKIRSNHYWLKRQHKYIYDDDTYACNDVILQNRPITSYGFVDANEDSDLRDPEDKKSSAELAAASGSEQLKEPEAAESTEKSKSSSSENTGDFKSSTSTEYTDQSRSSNEISPLNTSNSDESEKNQENQEPREPQEPQGAQES